MGRTMVARGDHDLSDVHRTALESVLCILKWGERWSPEATMTCPMYIGPLWNQYYVY